MDRFSHEKVDTMGLPTLETWIPKLVDSVNTSYYNLGGLVRRVRDEGLFVHWENQEYPSFERWCEDVLGFRLRKAQHLITIYVRLRELQPKPKTMDRLLALGWVKLSQILRVTETKKDLLKWMKVAEGMSLRELQGKVGFAVAQAEKDPDDVLNVVGDEPTYTKKITLTESQNDHLNKVMGVMRNRFPSAGDGALLEMMATAYLSGHVRDDEGGLVVELSYLLGQIETAYGVKLVVANGSKKAANPGKKKKKKGSKVS